MTLRTCLFIAALAMPWAASAATPGFTSRSCPAAATKAVVPITCGTVAVPEDRANKSSRLIDIFVITAHARVPHPAHDPVVIAFGGPEGAINSIIANLSRPGAEALLGSRDLIAFDYRGLGYSKPNLDCPTNAQGETNVAACVASLRKSGAMLEGYTTASVAADLHDIRVALHLPAINLWGTSYGSRVALTLARDFPSDLRSMILDGPYPLQSRENAALLVERAEAVQDFLAACQGDRICNGAFPHLYERYQAAIPRLNAHPIIVDGTRQTGDQLTLTLFEAQTDYAALPLLPAVMDKMARGTLTTLSSLSGPTADSNAGAVAAQRLLSCNAVDYQPDVPGLRSLLGTNPIIDALDIAEALHTYSACRAWPFHHMDVEDLKPLVSDTPTLLFSGQYDPTLPLPQAGLAARTLRHSRIVQFPGYAHVALGNGPCPVSIAQQLFDSLQPNRVDTSCTQGLPQPAWVTKLPPR